MQAFRMYDQDGSGQLDENECKDILDLAQMIKSYENILKTLSPPDLLKF